MYIHISYIRMYISYLTRVNYLYSFYTTHGVDAKDETPTCIYIYHYICKYFILHPVYACINLHAYLHIISHMVETPAHVYDLIYIRLFTSM